MSNEKNEGLGGVDDGFDFGKFLQNEVQAARILHSPVLAMFQSKDPLPSTIRLLLIHATDTHTLTRAPLFAEFALNKAKNGYKKTQEVRVSLAEVAEEWEGGRPGAAAINKFYEDAADFVEGPPVVIPFEKGQTRNLFDLESLRQFGQHKAFDSLLEYAEKNSISEADVTAETEAATKLHEQADGDHGAAAEILATRRKENLALIQSTKA